MKFGNVGAEIYLSNIERNVISTTEVPMTIPEETMAPINIPTSGKVRITLDRKEIIRLYMCQNDRTGMLVCIYGGKEGALIKRAQASMLPQPQAPEFKITGIRADKKTIVPNQLFEYILAGNTGFFMVEAKTGENTKPGVYRTILEIEFGWPEAACTTVQIPIEIYVAEQKLQLNNYDEVSQEYDTPLDAMLEAFNAYKQNRGVRAAACENNFLGKCSELARYNLALTRAVAGLNPENADMIADIMCAYKGDSLEDSAVYRIRKIFTELFKSEEW